MLFLPIDNSLFSSSQPKTKLKKALSRYQQKGKSLNATFKKVDKDSRCNTPKNGLHKRSHGQNGVTMAKPKAVLGIRDGSKDAVNLIKLMRNVQSKHQASLVQDSSIQHQTDGDYGIGPKSPQRVMTTMSPSALEKLRKNLYSFSRDRPMSVQKERTRYMKDKSGSIMKLSLPGHTKHAYNSRVASTLGSRKNSLGKATAQQATTFDGGVLPYSKDINDETYLFKVNAAQPLVSEQRQVRAIQTRRNTSSAMQAQVRQTSIMHDNKPLSKSKLYPQPTDGQHSQLAKLRTESSFFSYPNSQQTSQEKLRKVIKYNLLAKQKETNRQLSAGKSRHFSPKRNSHQECKLIYQSSQDILTEPSPGKFVGSKCNCSSGSALQQINFCSNQPYGHIDACNCRSQGTGIQEPPFTVKLCVKCQRSVKFRKSQKSPVRGSVEVRRSQSACLTQEDEQPQKVNQFTQMSTDFEKRHRNQRFTQTQQTANDAYTQSEVRLRSDQGTSISARRFHKITEDRQVQTKKERPRTSLTKAKKRRYRKTYQYINSEPRLEPEVINGRSFVIYNRQEYDQFLDSKRGHGNDSRFISSADQLDAQCEYGADVDACLKATRRYC